MGFFRVLCAPLPVSPCVHPSHVETCKSMKQTIPNVNGVRLRMALRRIHYDGSGDRDEGTAVVVVNWFVVLLELQRARWIVCTP